MERAPASKLVIPKSDGVSSNVASNQIDFKFTFDNLTQSLSMFDAEDSQNWEILAYTVSLLVSDTLSIFMVPPTELSRPLYEMKDKNLYGLLPPVELSRDTANQLIAYSRIYAKPILEKSIYAGLTVDEIPQNNIL